MERTMNQLTKNDLHAVRAFHRLLSVHTEGWDEAEGCDRHYDGGEWSAPAWGRNWQEADEHCYRIIADRFDLSPEYVMHLVLAYCDEEQHYFWKASHVKYVIWGSMGEGTEQEIRTMTDRRKATKEVRQLNDQPSNHPDLFYWFEVDDTRPLEPIPYGDTPATLSGHKAICDAYTERGLECPCYSEGVKQAIRQGARPEEVM
jgi:hypothetical protein